ncbi:MAG: phosphomannomutase [Parcubacteria group bacterium Athens0714_26]|nr:MAG: phosphomannomutase [Parcubacteria group bacterium Athens1014_26]TSD01653.1 MAG: phosphomannomutase [Parcubacteria group bacterium Athens0714_26]
MDYINLYVKFLRRFLKIRRPIKIVFDCSNGATGNILKELFKGGQKSKVYFLNERVDGNFSAHGPDPMRKNAAKELEEKVKKQKADIGVIFDVDGDRVFFIDDRGRLVDQDEIGFILAKFLKSPYVVGVNSGELFRNDKNAIVSRTGHCFYKKLMREKDISFGFERSGHYYFKDFFYCDSGIFAALKVINFVSSLDTDFSDYLDGLPKYFRSGEMNIDLGNLSEEVKKEIILRLEHHYNREKKEISKIDCLTMVFNDWRFNVRFSNTENLLRMNIEAGSHKLMKKKSSEVRKFIKSVI